LPTGGSTSLLTSPSSIRRFVTCSRSTAKSFLISLRRACTRRPLRRKLLRRKLPRRRRLRRKLPRRRRLRRKLPRRRRRRRKRLRRRRRRRKLLRRKLLRRRRLRRKLPRRTRLRLLRKKRWLQRRNRGRRKPRNRALVPRRPRCLLMRGRFSGETRSALLLCLSPPWNDPRVACVRSPVRGAFNVRNLRAQYASTGTMIDPSSLRSLQAERSERQEP